MVLTKDELGKKPQHELRILLHLASFGYFPMPVFINTDSSRIVRQPFPYWATEGLPVNRQERRIT